MKREELFCVFSSMPRLMSARLDLRALRVGDAEDMFEYASREDVTEYLLWSPHKNLQATRDYLKYVENRYAVGDFYDWAVIEAKSGKMIGTCGFARIDAANEVGELGYVINPDYRGMGYATEACSEVIRFGFERLGLHRIEARFMEGNGASLRVMEKLGMRFEGFERDSIFVKGRRRTVGKCAILKSDIEKEKA